MSKNVTAADLSMNGLMSVLTAILLFFLGFHLDPGFTFLCQFDVLTSHQIYAGYAYITSLWFLLLGVFLLSISYKAK